MRERITELEGDLRVANEAYGIESRTADDWMTRAETAEADLAEARKVLSEVQQQSSDGLEHTMTHALYSALEGIGDTARAFLAKEK